MHRGEMATAAGGAGTSGQRAPGTRPGGLPLERPVGRVLALILLLLLGACGGPRVELLMPTPALFTEFDRGPLDHIPEGERWKPRRVYYATTRERSADLRRIDYTNQEADEVSVGMALVGFGGPEVTWSQLNTLSRVAERPQPVDLTIAGLVEAGSFSPDREAAAGDDGGAVSWLVADLNAAIASARSKDLLIYVHGAKVDFYNACAFAAQIDHFMGRDMTSLAFSWPTRQNIIAYGTGGDVRRSYRAADSLAALLWGLAKNSEARRIHIVAWSAGGRVVTSALSRLRALDPEASADEMRERYRIGTVYLAAADVPQEEFLDELPALNDLTHRLVVTASSNDGALKMASRFMGGGTRIGQVDESLSEEKLDRVLAADRLEVINVSRGWEGRGFDITGHRYWFNHPWASTDLILAIRGDLAPVDRALEGSEFPILWALPADYPERLRSGSVGASLRER